MDASLTSAPARRALGVRLRQPLRALLGVLSIASQAKSFEAPVLGSRRLNRCGLHVARVVAAHAVMAFRRLLLGWRLSAQDRRDFARDGFLVKHDFLPPDLFAALLDEARELATAGIDSVQGDTQTRQVLLGPARLQRYAAVRATLQRSSYRALLGYVAGKVRVPFRWIQVIRSGARPHAPPDPQRDLHADTFQPNMKAWLFLTAADASTGAFTYVPGSHRLSGPRLRWEYRRSVIGARLPDALSARGSLRIDAAELPSLGLPPPRALTVPANTLVVADTCGFHCRGPAVPGSERMEVWALSRTNPFNPLPGLPFEALDRLDLAMVKRFEKQRRRARRRAAGA